MAEPITFYNRSTRQLETEAVYGESFLRWAYENPLGRAATWLLVKRAVFSKWYGWRMNQPASREKIAPFIAKYGVDTGEMAENAASFPHFNAFFSRGLKPSARPITGGDRDIAFPADGRHLVIPSVGEADDLFVKGIGFNLAALLGESALAAKFHGGGALISRLCPVDYHRFHFPVAGQPHTPRLINGPLYSVNPIALRQRPTLLWENKRYLTVLESALAGQVMFLEVGATCVGTVVHSHVADRAAMKGDEKGYFLFGGSCVITLFEPGRIKFAEDLVNHSAAKREVYAKMGECCGEAVG